MKQATICLKNESDSPRVKEISCLFEVLEKTLLVKKHSLTPTSETVAAGVWREVLGGSSMAQGNREEIQTHRNHGTQQEAMLVVCSQGQIGHPC